MEYIVFVAAQAVFVEEGCQAVGAVWGACEKVKNPGPGFGSGLSLGPFGVGAM